MQSKARVQRLFIFVGGLFGLAGIALSAAAAHVGDERLLGGAAAMCIAHGPALLALGLAGDRLKTALPAGILMIVGNLLFSGDLLARHFLGSGLFPMSAPSGGITMMAGWLAVAVGAVFKR